MEALHLPSDTHNKLQPPRAMSPKLRQPEVATVVSWHQTHCMGTSPLPRVTCCRSNTNTPHLQIGDARAEARGRPHLTLASRRVRRRTRPTLCRLPGVLTSSCSAGMLARASQRAARSCSTLRHTPGRCCGAMASCRAALWATAARPSTLASMSSAASTPTATTAHQRRRARYLEYPGCTLTCTGCNPMPFRLQLYTLHDAGVPRRAERAQLRPPGAAAPTVGGAGE